ncbi:MAG: glutamate--cysteine ligase [Betaproteobacteria bacterium]|nr:glutamate--cysteine ligase [Betaproteobacteria bacterium]
MTHLQERLRALAPGLLRGLRRGIEKESLRVGPEGALAATPHPAGLGSALTHPHITTDYSEAQLELITGVHTGIEPCLDELTAIHQFVYSHLDEEAMWAASMPCTLPDDDAIPIGRYGSSNLGRAKTVYRIGLAHRYGRRMQTISGVHYNFSLPEAAWGALAWPGGANAGYFALARNFRRHSWLLMYLFGASPAVCATFVEGREHDLDELRPGILYRPVGTSIRMGRLGYQSSAQSALLVSYNSLESYADSLHEALTRSYPPYEAIGIRGPHGEYRQLATSLLQIENEFYSTIRPKRTIRALERPLHALRERGVEYVEVRLMDLDAYSPIGIRAETMRFLDMFLLHCLLTDSPPDTPEEIASWGRNQHRAAARGRGRGLLLERRGEEIALPAWGAQVLGGLEPVAAALDAAHRGHAYRDALGAAFAALADPDSVPSARMLREMRSRNAGSCVDFALARSLEHRAALRSLPLAAETERRFARMAEDSLAKQRAIETADDVDFETFRRRYVSAEQLTPLAAAGR